MAANEMRDAVLDFWFGPAGSGDYGKERDVWFRKDDSFDAMIRQRFGELVDHALMGECESWSVSPRGALASIVVLDQFTRNIYRGTPKAFAGDALALAAAQAAVAREDDGALIAVERWFLYLPFTHAESSEAQQRALALFARLRDETGLADPLLWAERHASVIARFGRFPHRNGILGRQSTASEAEFLSLPGSRF